MDDQVVTIRGLFSICEQIAVMKEPEPLEIKKLLEDAINVVSITAPISPAGSKQLTLSLLANAHRKAEREAYNIERGDASFDLYKDDLIVTLRMGMLLFSKIGERGIDQAIYN